MVVVAWGKDAEADAGVRMLYILDCCIVKFILTDTHILRPSLCVLQALLQ